MNEIEKIKAVKELRQIRKELSSGSLKPIPKIKAVKRLRELRSLLGASASNELDESSLKPLNIPDGADKATIKKAVMEYLHQIQGKMITTVDGKRVKLNKNGRNHLIKDSVFDQKFAPQAISKVLEVLQTGKFIERLNLSKTRDDAFIAFHVYRKWVSVDGADIHLQIKVGEMADGTLAWIWVI